MSLSVALYQPDIAGNAGTILRLGACLGIAVEIIEPAGFDLSDRALKRAGMDYLETARLTRHLDFAAFEAARRRDGRRLVLFTPRPPRGSPTSRSGRTTSSSLAGKAPACRRTCMPWRTGGCGSRCSPARAR